MKYFWKNSVQYNGRHPAGISCRSWQLASFHPERVLSPLAVSIFGFACSAYQRTPPRKPSILTRPEDSPCGQPSLSTFSGRSFLPEEKLLLSRSETSSFLSGVSGWESIARSSSRTAIPTSSRAATASGVLVFFSVSPDFLHVFPPSCPHCDRRGLFLSESALY
jgi:hypothetical protein